MVEHGKLVVQKLREDSGESVAVLVRVEQDIMNVSKEDPLQLVNRTIQMGEHSPMLAAASGKAILAYLPDHEIEQYSSSVKPTAITPKKIADLKVVESKLDGICSYGTACDRHDISDRMIAMAALMFDLYALVVASSVVSFPAIRLTPEKKSLITYVSQEAFVISSRKLGFKVSLGVN